MIKSIQTIPALLLALFLIGCGGGNKEPDSGAKINDRPSQGDSIINEKEGKGATANSTKPFMEYSQSIVKRFDKDGDGKLSEEERTTVAATLREEAAREKPTNQSEQAQTWQQIKEKQKRARDEHAAALREESGLPSRAEAAREKVAKQKAVGEKVDERKKKNELSYNFGKEILSLTERIMDERMPNLINLSSLKKSNVES